MCVSASSVDCQGWEGAIWATSPRQTPMVKLDRGLARYRRLRIFPSAIAADQSIARSPDTLHLGAASVHAVEMMSTSAASEQVAGRWRQQATTAENTACCRDGRVKLCRATR